jgi:glycosyltransferase involved in cell wall biosynthesis
MRACLELRPSVHPDDWAARHRRGEVPDHWPYGLDRLANYGIKPGFRRPLSGRVSKRIARALRAKGGGFEWLESAVSLVSRERRRSDIILCWDEYAGVPAVMREQAIRGRPVVTGVVWLADDNVAPSIVARAARRALPRAALVWASSSGMLPALKDDWKVPSERLHHVPLGVDADFFHPTDDPPQPGLVVSAGNDRHRDHALLVRVIAEVQRRCPSARLELATRLPVHVPPGIGQRRIGLNVGQIAQMYRRAALVVVLTHPNVHASGLTVILEAMASAQAVVVTNNPGLSDYVSDGLTGLLVPPGDLRSAARAIEALLADPDRGRAMGLEGRRAVADAFTTEVQAARLAELMREVA